MMLIPKHISGLREIVASVTYKAVRYELDIASRQLQHHAL